MALARKFLVRENEPGVYHLVSRCVRREYLCGNQCSYRRQRLEDLVERAQRSFAVDVFTYAIMDNHFHMVARIDPRRVEFWTDDDVARRWAAAHPRCPYSDGTREWTEEEIADLISDPIRMAKTRERLGSLSWFMKSIKEPLAKISNKEDGVTGHFWEARFHSTALLDQAAVFTCMAYNDLNPIRAKICDRPEKCRNTGMIDRIQARQQHTKACAILDPNNTAAKTDHLTPIQINKFTASKAAGPEGKLWINSIGTCAVDGDQQNLLSLDDYLTLVDQTGRIIRTGKRGAIPQHLAPILDRLQLDVDTWLDLMKNGGRMIGTAIGNAAKRTAEAVKRGASWIVDTVKGLYREPTTG